MSSPILSPPSAAVAANSTNTGSGSGQPIPIFDLNTKAVVSLKDGRLQECMDGLRGTLVQARNRLLQFQAQEDQQGQQQQQQPVPADTNSSTAAMDLEEESPSLPPLSLFTVPLFTHQQLFAPGDDLSAHCPLFDRAFVLGSDGADPSDNTWMTDGHCQNVTLGVLLYNLALAHHLTGIQKGVSTDDFRVAMNLYQMALGLVESSVRRDDDDQDDDSDLEECQNLVILLCAIFNNMANIHSRHYHVTETRNCQECLREIIECTSNAIHACAEEDHFFFYLNLFVTAPAHDFAVAPAA